MIKKRLSTSSKFITVVIALSSAVALISAFKPFNGVACITQDASRSECSPSITNTGPKLSR